LKALKSLSIEGNPIEIVEKRLSLIECLIMGGGGIYEPDIVTEKTVLEYFNAGFNHVAR
jgi:hypothetical protein